MSNSNKITRKNSYNRYTLPKYYPEIDAALRQIFKDNREATKSLYIQYTGANINGRRRRIELGTILDTLEDYGYQVEITIKKKEENNNQ